MGEGYLDDACGGDAVLRAKVVDLLNSYRSWSAPLGEPSAELLPKFGPYRCDAILGAGGMGTVYRAVRQDGEFDRKVAIKVLRGSLRSEFYKRRFLTERGILARLAHESIATLLDGGTTPEGEPYLVMELVEGERLDAYCDQHRLSVTERLRLFEQVLHAVEYAHRSLVVHRDLKPGNILVTSEGKVKLLDFGTSKLLEDDVTVTSLHAITPRYASPEQLRGEPGGIPSDVFAAGVVLFELLSGAYPFRDAHAMFEHLRRATGDVESLAASMARLVSAEEAAKRSASLGALRKLLGGDLGRIVAKSLAFVPEDRYPTIAALLEDLTRFQEGHPVRARPATFAYRAQRFISRRRWPIAAACVAVLVLFGTAAYAFRQAAVASKQAARAQAVVAFMERVFGGADGWQGGRNDIKVVEAMDRADATLRTSTQRLAPEVESEIRLLLGNTYSALEASPKALEQYRISLRLAEQSGDLPLRANARLALAARLEDQGAETEKLFRDALADAIQWGKQDPWLSFDAHRKVANFLRSSRPPSAETTALYLQAVAIAEANPKAIDSIYKWQAMGRLAAYCLDSNQFQEADRWANEALRGFRSLPRMPVEAVGVVSTRASLLTRLGRQAESVRLREEVLEIYNQSIGPHHTQTLIALGQWARAATNHGRMNEALPRLTAAITELRRKEPKCVFSQWNVIQTYAEILGRAGRFDEAERYAQEALGCINPENIGTVREGQSLFALGRAHRGQKRPALALTELERSLAIYTKHWGADHPATKTVAKELEVTRAARVGSTGGPAAGTQR
ncbi:hypothetical protein F183_A17740 [Bryobacterales bacterium F-183]|nr:hypothetical protein F183_A17740 [Bryobacterales bacterium F-183]